jgi:cytochrome c2
MPEQAGRKRFLWVAAALVVIGLCGYLYFSRATSTSQGPYLVGNAERGSALFYGSKQCGICHTVNGNGGRIAPELSGTKPSQPAMGWLTSVLWNHGPGMWRRIRQSGRTYPELSPQEMADILAFLYQSSSIAPPGNATQGAIVFHEKGCDRCHAIKGAGGKVAPDLSTVGIGNDPNSWATAMLNHAGSMVEPINDALGQWPSLSGSEMNDLIAYVSTSNSSGKIPIDRSLGDAQKGSLVFESRCRQCHAVNGLGGKVGPELGPGKDIELTTAGFASLMWNHAPGMIQEAKGKNISVGHLDGNDMADLVAFLASLRYVEPSGTSLVGQRVFKERGCATCHGVTGEGTNMGPRPKRENGAYTSVSFTASLWQHGPEMADRAEESGTAWPELQATDIGNLVSFLNAIPNPK